jgi:hypothetical protein
MPAYSFLFQDVKVSGQVPKTALRLTGKSAPSPGHAVVPTERAQVLVAYLLSLNTAYDYPESRPVVKTSAKAEGAHK